MCETEAKLSLSQKAKPHSICIALIWTVWSVLPFEIAGVKKCKPLRPVGPFLEAIIFCVGGKCGTFLVIGWTFYHWAAISLLETNQVSFGTGYPPIWRQDSEANPSRTRSSWFIGSVMSEWIFPCYWCLARRNAGSWRHGLMKPGVFQYFLDGTWSLLSFLPFPNKGVPLFAQHYISITAWFWHGELWVSSLWLSCAANHTLSVKHVEVTALWNDFAKDLVSTKNRDLFVIVLLEGCFLHDCSKIRRWSPWVTPASRKTFGWMNKMHDSARDRASHSF